MPNKKPNETVKKLVLLLTALVSLMALLSCKAKTITVVQTVTATETASGTTAASTATPKLFTTSISLTIVAPAQYASAAVPIYITKNQTIHLNWSVVGGPILMSFTGPSGKVGSVSNSGITTASPTVLGFVGEVDFCPSDGATEGNTDWGGDGYYYFIPNIIAGDIGTKITINYWIEA